jgi:hypothetical protein
VLTIDAYASGAGGTLTNLLITDNGNVKGALTLYLFNSVPTTIADNAAFAPGLADLQKLVGVVAIAGGDYTTVNSKAYAVKTSLLIDFSTSTGNLYAYAVCTGTPSYGSTADLTFRFVMRLD